MGITGGLAHGFVPGGLHQFPGSRPSHREPGTERVPKTMPGDAGRREEALALGDGSERSSLAAGGEGPEPGRSLNEVKMARRRCRKGAG